MICNHFGIDRRLENRSCICQFLAKFIRINQFVRDVEPGEIVTIDKDGIRSDKSLCLKPEEQARCVF